MLNSKESIINRHACHYQAKIIEKCAHMEQVDNFDSLQWGGEIGKVSPDFISYSQRSCHRLTVAANRKAVNHYLYFKGWPLCLHAQYQNRWNPSVPTKSGKRASGNTESQSGHFRQGWLVFTIRLNHRSQCAMSGRYFIRSTARARIKVVRTKATTQLGTLTSLLPFVSLLYIAITTPLSNPTMNERRTRSFFFCLDFKGNALVL